VPDAQRFFTCFGCTITAVSGYSYTGDYSGNSTASLTVTFTANVENPVLAFGGHIARRQDWGLNSSAQSINGSPYHTRLISLNGAAQGNQDRSLNSNAVVLVGPTAASVAIAGRVLEGNWGVRNALVLLTDQNGETRAVSTNSFGYFKFEDVAAGETYVVNVLARRYSFAPQAVTVNNELTELNFTAEP
jgi:hypothetical protein